jgi:hypothetical protein
MAEKLVSQLTLRAEEEPEEEEADLVDPATEIKEKCAEDHCAKYKDRLDECNARVSSLELNLVFGQRRQLFGAPELVNLSEKAEVYRNNLTS